MTFPAFLDLAETLFSVFLSFFVLVFFSRQACASPLYRVLLNHLPRNGKDLGFIDAAQSPGAHPETVFLADLCVMLKILSSAYRLYACGKIFHTP